ncbi:hypothetical protein ACO2RV_15130 [Ancylobacter sp. VNQ12]|uniref:hypothetical protein n=1 Tax=Ancylobacter sp. VNQ12 TaxID=3400920 RepID=UPI003C0BFDF5
MFNVVTAQDFYAMLVQDFDDFCAEQHSARKAIHCAITANHMADWVWGDWLSKDAAARSTMGIAGREKALFMAWIDQHCVWFRPLQDIANGSKHFSRVGIGTSFVKGTGTSGHGMFGIGYLMIDWGEGAVPEMRYQAVASLLEVVVRFWRDFLRLYRPDPNQVDSRNHAM